MRTAEGPPLKPRPLGFAWRQMLHGPLCGSEPSGYSGGNNESLGAVSGNCPGRKRLSHEENEHVGAAEKSG